MRSKEINKKVQEEFSRQLEEPLFFFDIVPISKVLNDEVISSKRYYTIDLNDPGAEFQEYRQSVNVLIPKIKTFKNLDSISVDSAVRDAVTNLKHTIAWMNASMLLEHFECYVEGYYDFRHVTWGCPNDLKVTFKINENIKYKIENFITHAADAYGERYNTIVLNSQTLKNLFNDYESDVEELRKNLETHFQSVDWLGDFTVKVVDDSFTRKVSGENTPIVKHIPDNKTLLLNYNDYKQRSTFDFANCSVFEDIMGDVSEQFGPIGYFWDDSVISVVRGFPRKHRETCSATLTLEK